MNYFEAKVNAPENKDLKEAFELIEGKRVSNIGFTNIDAVLPDKELVFLGGGEQGRVILGFSELGMESMDETHSNA